MNARNVIQTNAEQVKRLCNLHRARALYLFGSAARDDFNPHRSDLDFLVEFQPMPPVERARHFFALRRALSKLFDRPVDLGERDGIRNPFVRDAIERTQVLVYDAA